MRHRANPRFWLCYQSLPEEVRRLADHCLDMLRQDPRHPLLHFKRVGPYWSVRVGLYYRALAVEDGRDMGWFWIGTHAEYDRILGRV